MLNTSSEEDLNFSEIKNNPQYSKSNNGKCQFTQYPYLMFICQDGNKIYQTHYDQTLDNCQEICCKNNKCTHYTFDTQNNECYLFKDQLKNKKYPNLIEKSTISGIRKGLDESQIYEEEEDIIDKQYSNIKEMDNISQDESNEIVSSKEKDSSILEEESSNNEHHCYISHKSKKYINKNRCHPHQDHDIILSTCSPISKQPKLKLNIKCSNKGNKNDYYIKKHRELSKLKFMCSDKNNLYSKFKDQNKENLTPLPHIDNITDKIEGYEHFISGKHKNKINITYVILKIFLSICLFLFLYLIFYYE
jgi:hypothetical protein